MHILDKIVAHKHREIAKRKDLTTTKDLEGSSYFERQGNSLLSRIKYHPQVHIIAEFKRKSPSKSAINLNADLVQVTRGYASHGASAISILTDEFFFGGHDQYLTQVRAALPETPLLRKEFIIDEYQIVEAKALGADIILLIAEILTAEQVKSYTDLARSLGLEVLLELHSADQLVKFYDSVTIVGVNNRDLKSFTVDYERSMKLFDQLPAEVPKIAESGLSQPATVAMLYQYGFRGFLIGEHFMRYEHPELGFKEFLEESSALIGRKHIVK